MNVTSTTVFVVFLGTFVPEGWKWWSGRQHLTIFFSSMKCLRKNSGRYNSLHSPHTFTHATVGSQKKMANGKYSLIVLLLIQINSHYWAVFLAEHVLRIAIIFIVCILSHFTQLRGAFVSFLSHPFFSPSLGHIFSSTAAAEWTSPRTHTGWAQLLIRRRLHTCSPSTSSSSFSPGWIAAIALQLALLRISNDDRAIIPLASQHKMKSVPLLMRQSPTNHQPLDWLN